MEAAMAWRWLLLHSDLRLGRRFDGRSRGWSSWRRREQAEAIVELRGRQPFRSLADFVQRANLDRQAMESLVLAGAFDSLGERRQLLWDLAEAFDIARRPQGLPLHIADERATMRPMATTKNWCLPSRRQA